MNELQKKQFFAMKEKEPTVVRNLGGKFSFSKLPKETRNKILVRLAEKDGVMNKGLRGILPGIKIDGREVTKDNIHEFEKKNIPKVKVIEVEKTKKELYKKADLELLSFSKLKKIAKKLGEIGRSKEGLIKDILKHN